MRALPSSDTPHASTPLEAAILAYLADHTTLADAAFNAGVSESEFVDAARRYQEAGRAALDTTDQWVQINIEFTDPTTADHVAASALLPALLHDRAHGRIRAWWFLRKPPGWRVRILPATTTTNLDALATVTAPLDDARSAGHVVGWWLTPYEPEIAAFGGPVGMALAHETFAADSTGLARILVQPEENTDHVLSSLLLMTHLQRAAGLDWNERGDVWARVAAQRTRPDLSTADLDRLTGQAYTIITTDTRAITRPAAALSAITSWAEDLDQQGRKIARAAHDGTLTRGLRQILSLHVIFHWNRMGLTASQQAVWAAAAAAAVFKR